MAEIGGIHREGETGYTFSRDLQKLSWNLKGKVIMKRNSREIEKDAIKEKIDRLQRSMAIEQQRVRDMIERPDHANSALLGTVGGILCGPPCAAIGALLGEVSDRISTPIVEENFREMHRETRREIRQLQEQLNDLNTDEKSSDVSITKNSNTFYKNSLEKTELETKQENGCYIM